MNRDYMEKDRGALRFQRNAFLVLSCLLAVSLLLSISLLFQKRERVIVVPPTIDREFWVEEHRISASYLEQFGYFLSQLLLGKSAQSAASQRMILMRHADPAFSGRLRNKLLSEEELLKRQNATYTFYPITVEADPHTSRVRIEGERVIYVNGKQLSRDREGYTLSFTYRGSRLLLSGIESSKQGEKLCSN